MGGHGGLNILPQKRWNVYNFDNRERVRRDEEAAARDEHTRQQQDRQKAAESRLVKLRDAAHSKRGSSSFPGSSDLQGNGEAPPSDSAQAPEDHDEAEKMLHINLFNGLIGFQRVQPGTTESKEIKRGMDVDKQVFRGDKELERLYKRATKEATQVGKNGVDADDEHYKLGYGCLGRDKKRPWYLAQSPLIAEFEIGTSDAERSQTSVKHVEKRKKTIDELREERLKREQQEREKAQRLLVPHPNGQRQKPGDVNKRRPYYNQSFGNAR